MYPKFPVNLSNPVAPGDSLTAEVSTNGSGSFTLTIKDTKQGWTFTTNQTGKKDKLGSAEWIAEAPSGSGGVLPLANFGTVNFTLSQANGQSLGALGATPITMVTSGGLNKAVPSTLDSTGQSFSVSWQHS